MLAIKWNGRAAPFSSRISREDYDSSGFGELRETTRQCDLGFHITGPKLCRVLSQSAEGVAGDTDKLPAISYVDAPDVDILAQFSQGRCDSSAVRYVREDAFDCTPSVVDEASPLPLLTLDVTEVDGRTTKTGCYLSVTAELLADFEGMQRFVDQRLMLAGLRNELFGVITGTGVWPQPVGLASLSGAQTLSAGDFPSPMHALGAGAALLMKNAGAKPDSIILHPNDARDMRPALDGAGSWMWPPWAPDELFGAPVFMSDYATEGTGYILNARQAGVIYRRSIGLAMVNNHDANFKANIVTCRVTIRSAITWPRPAAVVRISGIQ